MKTGIVFASALLVGVAHGFGLDNIQPHADCVIQLDVSGGYPNDAPILTDASDQLVFPEGTYFNDDRSITVAEDDFLYLACSGYAFADSRLNGAEFATARCAGGQFGVSTPENPTEELMDFGELGCTDQPDDETFEPGTTCGPNNEGIEVQLGFQVESHFASIISVCFDDAQDRTIYAKHTLPRQNVARDTGNDRPYFQEDIYYDYDVNDAYTQETQLITIDILTGGRGVEYVDPSSDRYLARGHYSPNADPVYYSHQDATFYFVNVGPQWQCFNGGNWVGIENSVRTFVEANQFDVDVYSGSHGTLQLNDIDENPVDITLHDDVLPVAAYYWKVVHDPVANTAVALIGVNNPYVEDILGSIVCAETISNHPMLAEVNNPMDPYTGIVYACETGQVNFEEIPSELIGLPLLT